MVKMLLFKLRVLSQKRITPMRKAKKIMTMQEKVQLVLGLPLKRLQKLTATSTATSTLVLSKLPIPPLININNR
jgi:hypothetical protein